MVNGKPVAPRLMTLEVNLIGVFYSEPQSLPTLYARSNNSDFDVQHQPSTSACITSSATAPLVRGKQSS